MEIHVSRDEFLSSQENVSDFSVNSCAVFDEVNGFTSFFAKCSFGEGDRLSSIIFSSSPSHDINILYSSFLSVTSRSGAVSLLPTDLQDKPFILPELCGRLSAATL